MAKRGLWDEIGGYDDDNVYVFLIPLASTSSGNDHIICIICLQSCFLMSKRSNLAISV